MRDGRRWWNVKPWLLKRDDLTAELLSLWNASGHYTDTAAVLDTRVFHPWEGGEGKITSRVFAQSTPSGITVHRAWGV
ncbi:hypothetical protein MJK72_21475 [Klebsiella pneumoniae]|nr:hypothetical protein MJK72_21475 [Klebsiella pneumoniae]